MTIHEEALAARVRETLNMDKRISNLPISVRVTDSIIFLKGTVDTLEQLETVKFLVTGIAGVQHINVDELEIREANR